MATLNAVVRAKLTALFERVEEELIRGGAADFSQYRYYVGYLRGVYDSREEILPILDRIESDDDEEEGR